MRFQKQKSFGPRISLTDRQIDRLRHIASQSGRRVNVENCRTGSVYITVHETEVAISLNGTPFESDGDEIAKIRLSGHDEGRRQDATHSCVGGKRACLQQSLLWLTEICEAVPA